MRLGIAHKLTAWLLVVFLIMLFAFWLTMDRFQVFQRQFATISDRELPDLIAVAELEQETARLASMAQDILLSSGTFVFTNIHDLVETSAQQAQRITERLHARTAVSERASRLAHQYEALVTSLRELAQLREREHRIIERIDRVRRRLGQVAQELNAEDFTITGETTAQWHRLLNRQLARLQVLTALGHPQRIGLEQTAFREEAERSAAALEAAAPATTSAAQRLQREVHDQGLGTKNLFQLVSDRLVLGRQIEDQIFDLRHLLDQIRESSRTLHQQIKSATLKRETELRVQIERFRILLLSTALAGVLLLLAIHLFIRRSLLDRILELQTTMKANTDGEPKSVPVRGNDEIALMAQEANYFIAVIQQREGQLRGALERADAANRTRGEFIANISHEIRTPMNGILNFAALIAEDPLTRRQRDRLQKVERASAYLLGLINDILDFSRIDAGRLEIESTAFRSASLAEAVEIQAEEAQQKGLGFGILIDPQTPQALRGDPLRIQQILRNLTSNALKFTDRGAIDIGIRGQRQSETDCLLEITVRDTGIGIEADKLEHVFAPFNQADSSTTRRYGGSGLGLTICRRLAELMGGHIEARSTPGSGSLFRVQLPLQIAPIEEATETSSLTASDLGTLPGQGLHGRLVLVVEDSELNQAVIIELLEQAGVQWDLASNGQEALELAAESPYDAVLMDIQMPGMDGFETSQRLRALPKLESLPIIGFTADAQAETRRKCRDAGMDDLLTKPVSPQRLYRMLRHWIPGPPAARPGDDTAPTDGLAPWQHRPHLLRLFLDNYRNTASRLRRQLAERDWKGAILLVHNLRSAAATFGAMDLSATAAEIETRLKTSESRQLPAEMLGRLAAQLQGLAADIEGRLRTADAPPELAPSSERKPEAPGMGATSPQGD